MSIKRRTPTMTEKLASALLSMVQDDGTGKLTPVLDRDECRDLTAHQICSLVQFDHGLLHSLADTQEEAELLMHPSNLTPRLIVSHRQKSKGDTTAVAKTKRISAEAESFQRRILAKTGQAEPTERPKSKFQSRGFQQGQRKMQSRGFRK